MDNWDDFRFVVALARFGTMSQAAKHLRTNTATVSRRIKRINETMGSAVFHKGANDWELTAAGLQLFDIAAKFHDDLRQYTDSQAEEDEEERVVRISTIEFIIDEILTDGIAEFYKAYPNIRLEISGSDHLVSLAYGEADLAVRLRRPDEGRLIAKQIGSIQMGVYGLPNEPSSPWVGLPNDLDWTPEMENGLAYFGCPPSVRLASFNSIRSTMEKTGMGGIAPDFMMNNSTNHVCLQDTNGSASREAWLVYHETRKSDRVLRLVSRWIEQTFAKKRLS